MKTFYWMLTLINLMFGLATAFYNNTKDAGTAATYIYSAETDLNNSLLKQKDNFEPSIKARPIEINPKSQKLDLKKAGPRISETKCLDYIRERTIPPNIQTDSRNKRGAIVIGGRDALEREFPHMGALGWKTVEGTWIFKCGSSLISPKFSLTAAHCSRASLDRTIVHQVPEIVRLGGNTINDVFVKGDHSIDANILRIIVHPQFSSPKKYYDIALVELKSELQFSGNVQPVCLWNSFNTSSLGTKVTSTGWGVVNTTTKKKAVILQTVEIDIIDSQLCDKLLEYSRNRHWGGLREHQLCAGKLAGGVEACLGGGPLQGKINLSPSNEETVHYLIGVNSFGIGCARPNLPGVYTRVSSFVDWIESIVWPGH